MSKDSFLPFSITKNGLDKIYTFFDNDLKLAQMTTGRGHNTSSGKKQYLREVETSQCFSRREI